MTNAWTPATPASYTATVDPTAAKANQEIRDRATYLYSRYRKPSQLDVVNTAVETDVLNLSIPASDAGSDRLLRMLLIGDYLNSTGGGQNLRMRIALGGTTLWDLTKNMVYAGAGADRRAPFRITFEISQLATNSQFLAGNVFIAAPDGGNPGTGCGAQMDPGTTTFAILGSSGAASIDMSSAARTLSFFVTHGSSSVGLSFRRQYALAYLL